MRWEVVVGRAGLLVGGLIDDISDRLPDVWRAVKPVGDNLLLEPVDNSRAGQILNRPIGRREGNEIDIADLQQLPGD